MKLSELSIKEQTVIKYARMLEQIYGIGTVFVVYDTAKKFYKYVIHNVGETQYSVLQYCINRKTVKAMLAKGLIVYCDRNHNIIAADADGVKYFGLRICTACVT